MKISKTFSILSVLALVGVLLGGFFLSAAGQGQGGGTGASPGVDAEDPLLKQCGRFSIKEGERTGVLKGYWRDGVTDALPHALIILSVKDSGKAKVLYSHGRYQPWKIDYSECEKFSGTFVNPNTLIVKLRDGRTAKYDFVDGTTSVGGTYTSRNGTTRGTFEFVKLGRGG